jgi:hypothetical protein
MNVNCRSGWRQQNVNTDTNGSNELNGEGEDPKEWCSKPRERPRSAPGSIGSIGSIRDRSSQLLIANNA